MYVLDGAPEVPSRAPLMRMTKLKVEVGSSADYKT